MGQRVLIDGKVLDLDMEKLLNVEVIAMTKVTKLKFTELTAALGEMDMEALTAFLWIVRKRDEPELRYSDVTFSLGSIKIEDDGDPKDSTSENETTADTSQSSPISSDSIPGTSTD
jgi:hypothetical protein